MFVVYRVFGRRAHALNRDLNNETEREVEPDRGGPPRARSPPISAAAGGCASGCPTRRPRSWSLVELFSIGAVVLMLLRSTALPNIGAGELYAMLAYVWRVLEGLDQVPMLVQRLGRLLDIRRRLDLGEAA